MTVLSPIDNSLSTLPRLPVPHVARSRLSVPLLSGRARVRLLCAPAGTGKTVLIAECMAQRPADCAVHWLALGGSAAGVAEVRSELAERLGVRQGTEAALLAALRDWRQPTWIVLDDYCRQPDRELDDWLYRVLASSSPALIWWISARRRPDCNLSRLIIEGTLLELDAGQLAFDAGELKQLLQATSVEWPTDAAERLLNCSGGWCAGARMALLEPTEWQLLEGGLAQGVPATLDEYLAHELFAGLSAEQAYAWRALVHLPRFNAAICDHLFGPGHGAQLLQDLRELGCFIEPCPEHSGWLRILPAIAKALRQFDAEQGRAWHLQACQWFAVEGDWQVAVEHALQARQPETAISLLGRIGVEQLFDGRGVALLLRIHEEIGAESLCSSIQVLRVIAGALLIAGRLEEAGRYIDALVRFIPQPDAASQAELLAVWLLLQGLLAHMRGEDTCAHRHLEEALRSLPEGAWELRLLCLSAHTRQALQGNRSEEARAFNRAALRLARSNGSLILEAFLELDHAQLLEYLGKLRRADSVLERAGRFLQAAGYAEGLLPGRLSLGRGGLALRRGRYEESRRHFLSGLQQALAASDHWALFGFLGLAKLDAEQRDFDRAFERLHEAERLMQLRRVSQWVYRALLLQASSNLLLLQRRGRQARSLLLQALRPFRGGDGRQTPPATIDLVFRLELQLAIAEHYDGERFIARQRLQGLQQQAQAQRSPVLRSEVALALAELEYVEGGAKRCAALLQQGLSKVERTGLLLPLREMQIRQPGMLPTFQPPVPSPVRHEPACRLLSLRELQVLGLVAQGCSNQEIADRLFISLHTVKTHTRRINRKLEVKRRTQAVARAKMLGLM